MNNKVERKRGLIWKEKEIEGGIVPFKKWKGGPGSTSITRWSRSTSNKEMVLRLVLEGNKSE